MLVGEEFGPFRIEKELGSGAMGTVFRAFHKESKTYVALKIIGIGQLANETSVARFEREQKILEQLRHPNIVRLFGRGRKKNTPYFAMELVEGESLDKVLARRGQFSWEQVVELGKQLCSALQHAHARGIVHRDLKPSNVMVLPDGTVKLTDFGIAKDVDVTALTGANSTVGTAAYMSPEQCRGEKTLSSKSDLYSMGVMFYELLTGRKPFVADSPVEMFLKHVNETAERPSRLVLTIPVWLDTLVCQLMEKKPEHRPFDAAMVAKVLEEVEEKAVAQKSAGVDAAAARRIDRPGVRAEESDREAARALRGVRRRKPRRKNVPWWERGYLKAAGLLAALAGLVAILYFATRPPSSDDLYLAAKSAADSSNEDAAIRTTQSLLDRFPNLDDARAQEIKAWQQQFWTQKRERQLFNRSIAKLRLTPEDDGQRFSDDALRYENDGDREGAQRVWTRMQEAYADQPVPEPAVYAWVARKKLTVLQNMEHRESALLARINELRLGRKPPATASEIEIQYEEALRLADFGDEPAARDRWERIRDDHLSKSLDDRPWAIYAAVRVRQMKATAVTGADKERDFRRELIRKKLAEIDSVGPGADPTTQRHAVAICRDIIDMYGKSADPQIAAAVHAAGEKLKKLTAPE